LLEGQYFMGLKWKGVKYEV